MGVTDNLSRMDNQICRREKRSQPWSVSTLRANQFAIIVLFQTGSADRAGIIFVWLSGVDKGDKIFKQVWHHNKSPPGFDSARITSDLPHPASLVIYFCCFKFTGPSKFMDKYSILPAKSFRDGYNLAMVGTRLDLRHVEVPLQSRDLSASKQSPCCC